MAASPRIASSAPASDQLEAPLKPVRTILAQEIRQAEEELQRPFHGIFVSGVLAGIGVGTSTFAASVILSAASGELPPSVVSVLAANAYTVGFIVVILARTDLFTEYTTIAILPVLTGSSGIGALGRLWGGVYAGNLLGAAAFALLLSHLGPAMEIVDPQVLQRMASDLVHHSWSVILLSAILAGWLMGILSWLIAAGRETISQIFFVWMITGVIGLAHLHHSITGAVDVMAGMFVGAAVGPGGLAHVLIWTTTGNAIGGIIFAVLIRYSLVLREDADSDEGRGRREGDDSGARR